MMLVLLSSFLLCMGCFVSCDRTLWLGEDANTSIISRSCIEKEREALLLFKANLVDINNNLHDWGSQEEQRDCCRWVGVYCSYGPVVNVFKLDLSFLSRGLGGKISSSLLVLRQLQYLDLNGIDFMLNPIPPFLGSLANLRHLDISTSNLSGRIPRQLANLSNLIHLDLRRNLLEGSIPFPFRDLTSLTYLDLSENHLNGSLPNFSGCSSLSKLSLAHNSFNGSIPDFIGCRSLLELDLSSNRLSGNLPKSVGQLSNLEYLDVSSNSLEGVISDVHFLKLTRLTFLDMSFNSFAFELSSRASIPSQLKIIKLQSCKLGPNFPIWIQSQSNFTHLDISNANISDSIPTWFWHLSDRLEYLNLSSNELKGMLPNMTATRFDSYIAIDTSYNQLDGSIQSLPFKLSAINLSGNRFTGSLSFLCEIGTWLTFLDLSNNLLSGGLPDCRLEFHEALVVLNLSNNSLSGEIPSSLGLFSQLEVLYLRSNTFVGVLPISLSNCTKLRFVDIGENKLSGMIPAWIGERLSELSFLVLRSNRFNGILPSQLCWLNNLQFLDLSENRISGSIPRCVGNFTPMATMIEADTTNHYYNYFDGNQKTPSSIFVDHAIVAWKGTQREFGRGLKLLKGIDLSSNKLSGKLPYEITSLHELVSLNLSRNELHGEIPEQMGQLKYLETLDLSRNEFSEKIPSSLSMISFLSYLDLSNNNLSGSIPFGTQLQRFNSFVYSGNPHLCGPPLTTRCGLPPAVVVVGKEDEEDDELWKWYYIGMGSGFVVGFWGICATIFLNRSCKHFLFASLAHIKDWIYVTMVLHSLKLQRK